MDGYIYQFALGGIVFAIGVIYAWRQGYVGLQGRAFFNLILLFASMLLFAAVQGYLQYAPMSVIPPTEYKAGSDRPQQLGTPLDYGIIIGYFALILAIGTWFSRRQKSLNEFFFAGQRFSWWLIMFSLMATTVGSYSFVKYSSMAYKYGVGSTQTYLNDWVWLPLLLFGWLPILYFSRITSVPEYFERRFNRPVRAAATALVLLYLVSYVGVNLFTMGKVLNTLLDWPIFWSAAVVACVSAIYVTAGGQTSVIMTDLFQGVMLLASGVVILTLGCWTLGGPETFWNLLPRDHRLAFPIFNSDRSFPSVGIFWQDGIANTAMFYFLNQGILMRFMSAKSVNEARKAMFAVVLVLMPIAACVVASGGWVAKSMVQAGILPSNVTPDEAFFVVSEFMSQPGVFGLILAALTAALMSTVDTLITAVSAVTVNDFYRLFIRPKAVESELMIVARVTAVLVTVIGVGLVPVFMQFETIYAAHGAMTAAVTPPLVVALLLSVFWKRFTGTAALCTLVGGTIAIVVSILYPVVITPFAQGVEAGEPGEGILGGMKQFKFMRACYGICVCSGIAVIVTFMTKKESSEKIKGLVWGTVGDALQRYKGSPGNEHALSRREAIVRVDDMQRLDEIPDEHGTYEINMSRSLASGLGADVGDLIYVSDRRWWLGGLKSAHARLKTIEETGDTDAVILCQAMVERIKRPKGNRPSIIEVPVMVEKLY